MKLCVRHCYQDTPKRDVHAEGGAVSINTDVRSEDTEITDARNHRQRKLPKPRPPSENTPWVSQHPALFVTDVLRANFPRVFYIQGVDALEESPLIALTQIVFQTLNVSSKKHFVSSVADPVNMRVSLLLIPGCSVRDHHHVDLCFCLARRLPSTPASAVRRGGSNCSAVWSMVIVKAVSTS